MKIFLLLIWSGVICKLIIGDLVKYKCHLVPLTLDNANIINSFAKDFCIQHNSSTLPQIINNNEIIQPIRVKRDADHSGGRFRGQRSGGRFDKSGGDDRRQSGNRGGQGGFYWNRDNDYRRIENRDGGNRGPYQDRGNDRRPFNRDRDDNRRSFGDNRRSFGGDRGRFGDNRRSFPGRDGDQDYRRPFNNRGGDRRPFNNRGGDRRPYGDGGGDQRPYNDRGENRRPFNNRGGVGDQRQYNERGGDRRPFHNRGGEGDQRSYGDRDKDRRLFNDRRDAGDRRPYGDRGGDQRPFNDRGGNRRPFNNRGGERRSFDNRGDYRYGNQDGNGRQYGNHDGDRGGYRKPYGDRRPDRRSFGGQDDNQRPYSNRDRGGYGDRNRGNQNNDRQPFKSPYDRQQPRNKYDSGDRRDRTRKYGGPNVTKYRLIKITNRTKKGLDLKGTVTINLDEAYFEYSDNDQKSSSEKNTMEYDADYSIKGANLETSADTSEGADQAKHFMVKVTRKQKAPSKSDSSEEYYCGTDSSLKQYGIENDSKTDGSQVKVKLPKHYSGQGKSQYSSLNQYSTEEDSKTSIDDYSTSNSSQHSSDELESKLKQYSTEDDYDEAPHSEELEYSNEDNIETTKQNTNQESEYSDDVTHSKIFLDKSLAKQDLITMNQTILVKSSIKITPPTEITKSRTRNLQHRTPKQTSGKQKMIEQQAKVQEFSTKENSDDYDDSYKHDYTEEKSDHYKTTKRTRPPKKYQGFKPVVNTTSTPAKSSIKSEKLSSYENSGHYKDSNEYNHEYSEEELELDEATKSTLPLKEDYSTIPSKTLAKKSKKDHKTTSAESSYDSNYTKEESKDTKQKSKTSVKTFTAKKLKKNRKTDPGKDSYNSYSEEESKETKPPPKITSTPKKDHHSAKSLKPTYKIKSKKESKISPPDTDSEYKDSYKHDYTEERSENYKEKDPKNTLSSDQVQFYGDLQFYDDSQSALSQDTKNKLSSQMDYYKKHVYVYNAKKQEHEFVDESAFRKLNISNNLAFGRTERVDGKKRIIRRQEDLDVDNLNPALQRQLKLTSITWPVYTTLKKIGPRHRFTSRPHPPRKTFHGRFSRARRANPPKERIKH